MLQQNNPSAKWRRLVNIQLSVHCPMGLAKYFNKTSTKIAVLCSQLLSKMQETKKKVSQSLAANEVGIYYFDQDNSVQELNILSWEGNLSQRSEIRGEAYFQTRSLLMVATDIPFQNSPTLKIFFA